MLLTPKVTRVLGVAFACWFILAGVSVRAGSHLWVINELFSNADGTIQFVEMYNCCEPMEIYPAMLYGSLEDLQELGHIEEADEGGGRPPGQHERRRYYRITDHGREALAQETVRLESLTRAARQALGLS